VLLFSVFLSGLAAFESKLPLLFVSTFPSQLLLSAFGPDSILKKVLLSKLPAEDFLPAVVTFNTEAAFSNKDNLEGDDLSAPFAFVLSFISFGKLSKDGGRERTLVGEEGVDLATFDFTFELITSFLSKRLASACFEREEFDLVSCGFLLSIPLLLTEAFIFCNLLCSFSSDNVLASLEPLVDGCAFLVPRKLEELVMTRSSGLPTQACLPATGLTPLKIGTGVAASRRST
jgi:hypothetical protein